MNAQTREYIRAEISRRKLSTVNKTYDLAEIEFKDTCGDKLSEDERAILLLMEGTAPAAIMADFGFNRSKVTYLQVQIKKNLALTR